MQAILLFAHGARAQAWATPFQAVRERLRAARPDLAVELAFLESMQPDFEAGVAALHQRGARRVLVCPLFLGASGHVLRDLPALVDAARSRFDGLSIECASALGEDAQVLDAIAGYCLSKLPAGN